MKYADSELIAYALGVLDTNESDALSAVLENSADARAALGASLSAIDELEDQEPAMQTDPQRRDLLFRCLDHEHRLDGFVARLSAFFDLEERSVETLLNACVDTHGAAWETSAVSGMRLLHFDGGPRVARADCGLVNLDPGTIFPRHVHNGDEWALILQGCVCENGQRKLHPGSVALSRAGHAHELTVVGDEAVIIAVVNYAPLEFQSSP